LLPAELEALAEPMARIARCTAGVVKVSFLPNTILRRLKKALLKKDVKFVDVLAFPEPKGFPHPETSSRFLGHVYLNAAFRSGAPEACLAMFIHGFTHLLGFSHDTIRDTIKMERLEKRLFARVQITSKGFLVR
jgi:ssRNA-specific RNase YbeY (16S rRNA maturation enzyme)